MKQTEYSRRSFVKGLSVGMNDYINKPFKEEDIGKALAEWPQRDEGI